MKLRNKKTGKTWFLEHIAILDEPVLYADGEPLRKYTTLAELNEEWEDYAPAEPLIKDEKARKAVRAWAEVLDIKTATYYDGEFYNGKNSIVLGQINRLEPLRNDTYSIEELCGEEEE